MIICCIMICNTTRDFDLAGRGSTRSPADCLGEGASLAVADVARRGAYELGHGVLLHELAHVLSGSRKLQGGFRFNGFQLRHLPTLCYGLRPCFCSRLPCCHSTTCV